MNSHAPNRFGYRGYIGSRRYRGERAPQHIQNLVVRDFCQRKGFTYLLSATEYAMEHCYMTLQDVAQEAEHLEGIVLYSIAMLPERRERREELIHKILDAGATIHAAAENIDISSVEDARRVEELFSIMNVLSSDGTVIKSSSITENQMHS
jgi:sporadic carbohydrate cluster protein (TIGR04323 family)